MSWLGEMDERITTAPLVSGEKFGRNSAIIFPRGISSHIASSGSAAASCVTPVLNELRLTSESLDVAVFVFVV